ncbi:hypothetical protein D3C74_329060 [compost metagenome]
MLFLFYIKELITLDPEVIQKLTEAMEAVQKIVKPIVEAVNRLWNTFKDWISKHPGIVKFLQRELVKRSRVGARELFRPQSAVKVYRSQVAYWPVRQVARSRC